jgi:hypothetical protein
MHADFIQQREVEIGQRGGSGEADVAVAFQPRRCAAGDADYS